MASENGSAVWTVVQSEHRKERTAARELSERGFRTYLPEYACRVKRSKHRSRNQRGRTEMVQRPLFPGYLFMQTVIASGEWKQAFRCKGVQGMLFTGENPARIPDMVIDALMGRANGGVSLDVPELSFTVGEQVRVEEGPFASFNALIERIEKVKAGEEPEEVTVHCLLSLFGRETRIEISASCLGRL